jgi:hypothetical protein
MDLTGYRISNREVPETDPEWHGTAWKVSLWNREGRKITVDFHQGILITEEPQLSDVLNAIISDTLAYDEAADVLDFAENFGYSLDTAEERRRIRKTYTACKNMSEKVHRWLDAEEFERLAYGDWN